MTDTDRLAALIDECYQRGLDAPEAATFLRAAGVTVAPFDATAPLDVERLAQCIKPALDATGYGNHRRFAAAIAREYAALRGEP